MFKGGCVTIYITDMDRAVEFYTEKLGLKLIYRAGDFWSYIDTGDGLKIGLHPVSPGAAAPGTNGSTTPGLYVSVPMEDAVAELTNRGIQFKGPITEDAGGQIKLAYLSDPDGNELYLCETKW